MIGREPLLPLAALVGCALLASAVPAQSVISVGHGSSYDGSNLASAISSAADGDTVIVQDGLGSDFMLGTPDIHGKSLNVVSEGRSKMTGGDNYGSYQHALRIHDLTADESLVVRAFDMKFSAQLGNTSVDIRDCAGPIVFEDCTFTSNLGATVLVSNAASVTFVRCAFDGDLVVKASNAFLYDTSVTGSDGRNGVSIFGGTIPPYPGRAAVILLDGSSLHASGCTFVGGKGGTAIGFCYPGTDGGSGVDASDGTPSTVRTRASVFVPGQPGLGTCGEADGALCVPVKLASGATHATLAGTPRSSVMGAWVETGTSLAMSFDGEPGDVAALLIDLVPSTGIDFPVAAVELHLTLGFFLLPLGVLPTGNLDVLVPIGPLPPGVEGIHVLAQTYYKAPGQQFDLTGPTVTTLLEP